VKPAVGQDGSKNNVTPQAKKRARYNPYVYMTVHNFCYNTVTSELPTYSSKRRESKQEEAEEDLASLAEKKP